MIVSYSDCFCLYKPAVGFVWFSSVVKSNLRVNSDRAGPSSGRAGFVQITNGFASARLTRARSVKFRVGVSNAACPSLPFHGLPRSVWHLPRPPPPFKITVEPLTLTLGAETVGLVQMLVRMLPPVKEKEGLAVIHDTAMEKPVVAMPTMFNELEPRKGKARWECRGGGGRPGE